MPGWIRCRATTATSTGSGCAQRCSPRWPHGRDAGYRRYDWGTGALAPDEIHAVSRSGIVVVEGVYTARPELAQFYDLVVYVDTPREESLRRLRERGHDHGPIDWEARWRLAEEHYLAVERPQERAHLVVSGH